MAAERRIRRQPTVSKDLILDATEKLMVEEGYAAVSTRRIGKEVGLTPALVHYYYATTDDVFAAAHARMTKRYTEALVAVLESDNPVRSMWEFQCSWTHSALGVEFIALANHRKAIRDIIVTGTDDARGAQADALEMAMSRTAISPAILPPVALMTIIVAIARMLVNEERLGITRGHDEVRAFVEWALEKFSTDGA